MQVCYTVKGGIGIAPVWPRRSHPQGLVRQLRAFRRSAESGFSDECFDTGEVCELDEAANISVQASAEGRRSAGVSWILYVLELIHWNALRFLPCTPGFQEID